MKRCCGILNHITSLPGPFGIGDMQSCFSFIDFLQASKQTMWQILPINPTTYGDSPYQSYSTFAGNHWMISPQMLIEAGLLCEKDLEPLPDFPTHWIDFKLVTDYKERIFATAFQNFKKIKKKSDYAQFCDKNRYWLEDYGLFIAIKEHFIHERKREIEAGDKKNYLAFKKENDRYLKDTLVDDYYYGAVWSSWPEELIARSKKEINLWQKKLAESIEYQKFLQYIFYAQWQKVKAYAAEHEILIVGDLPIFVAYDSADVWANQESYYLNAKGLPTKVAGVPPDYFSKTGQLWGNPLYHWENHKKDSYIFWTRRIKKILEFVDYVRIDHFRGFESFWAVPFGDETAENGKWMKGPQYDFFDNLLKKMGKLPIIAEDLGVITEKVEALRDHYQFPGMKVLQFAFDSPKNQYLPHNYNSSNCVVYTGTHDNNTTRAWFDTISENEKDFIRRYLCVDGTDPAWALMRLAYASCAHLAIIPIQDILNLYSDGRMNTPGTVGQNWRFRYTEDMITDKVIEGLCYLATLYNRYTEKEPEKTETPK